MKKFYLILMLWGIMAGAVAQTTLKVMSFNIHAGKDASLEQLSSFIKEQNPDIVALQEVDYYTTRNNVDMLLELAYRTGMHGMFFPTIDVHGGKYGNAILSKYSFEETGKLPLSYVTGTERRCAAVVRIMLPDGTSVRFAGTHLDMANQANGLYQIKDLNEIPQAEELCILAGDLNKRVDTEHINTLKKVWSLAISNGFDHIAYCPAEKWEVENVKIFDVELSDHKPIMTMLKLKKQ